ncbi:DHH family phosphoesterase [Vibrio sp. SCSIO 43136]|uniref:DHHA1 domain-containing protein n=1 Tax=Vibrio sp. SCSIO 43136 TaxID=2819101 RepID=UPI0020760FE5|nr:DHH family phosphoesterase [Vibrio sp. SCSIO 43136]USD65029.1 DHH family phosphoesterase [Vibrio sp. SCSIO 43136]
MAAYDIFNGDADGLTALVQLRLAHPKQTTLVTGVKRNIELLKSVPFAKGDELTVLDVSMKKNHAALIQALNVGCSVFYADHHQSGDIPKHDQLESHINTSANTCTALIIDKYLRGRYRHWAIVGAFGDNLIEVARTLASKAELSEQQTQQLHSLGTLLNYNGYGANIDDLLYPPEKLYQLMEGSDCPFKFMFQHQEAISALEHQYQQDQAHCQSLVPEIDEGNLRLFILPNAKWARRMSGILGNQLANVAPNKAHAILTRRDHSTWQVSIRAPLNRRLGADNLASQFETGGGRAGAAGINVLKNDDMKRFISLFRQEFSS